jgi:hypothetical protein
MAKWAVTDPAAPGSYVITEISNMGAEPEPEGKQGEFL